MRATPPRPRHASPAGPPRLILRFAVSTCVALALAAGAILMVVRYYDTVQAERAANSQARVVASTILPEGLEPSDFASAVGSDRRTVLDAFLSSRVLAHGFLRVELYDGSGSVTYSTDHGRIGRRAPPEHVREAAGGSIRGDVTEIVGAGEVRKALRTYAPVALAPETGVVALYQDYGPVARAAMATFVPVVGIFEAVLLVLFAALVPVLRSVVRRIASQIAEIEHRALHDSLTGLPNRTHFADRLGEAIDEPRAAVLLLDLDGFKDVNDTLGHGTGDELLRDVAARLRATLAPAVELARLGGDEFGILVRDASIADAHAVAEQVHTALDEPFDLLGLSLHVGGSVGIAHHPEHGTAADALLQRADVAMYVAKEARAKTSVYDAEQDANDADRLALAAELRRAIDDGQLVLFFQPKADLATAEIVGVEALVRWLHPVRGLIPPNEFIPIAEKTELIKSISRHVLGAALRQAQAWNEAGRDLHVSVNLTIPDLLDLELPGHIARLLDEHGVRPEQLELEITETTILADPFRVREVLTRFDEMGVGLAVDDFGTGYSSLAYLKRLPVRTIKIDRSFVMGMCESESDATIVRSIVQLGRNLGLVVVAEGVETQEMWDALSDEECTLAQGYLIGKPVPAGELDVLLDERAAAAA